MPSVAPNPVQNELESMKHLEWPNLIELDLSLFDDEIGKQRLANRLAKEVRSNGFFMLKNFGISKEAIEQQFKFCRGFFELPLEEKLLYYNKEAQAKGDQTDLIEKHRLMDRRINFPGRRNDNVQIYNIPKQNEYYNPAQPKLFQEHMKEIENFQRDIIENVVQKLFQLLAIVLQVPDENQLTPMIDFAAKGTGLTRFIKYGASSAEDIEADGRMFGLDHADLGFFTMNFRQPVAGFQLLDADREWKWAKPWEDSVMVNVGDTLRALTGGYVKSGMHRIHAPPKEQIHFDRFTVLYIARGSSDWIMDPIKNSPVLQCAELETVVGMDQGLTMNEWIKAWFTHLRAKHDQENARAVNRA